MSLGIQIKLDTKEFIASMNKSNSRFQTGISLLIRKTLFSIRMTMINLMNESKSGSIRKRGTITHRASAPGEAPAVDTGFLRQSIFVDIVTAYRGEVGATAPYAKALEGPMKRPFLLPSVEKNEEPFYKSVERLIGASF